LSQPAVVTKVWVARDFAKCSGCRLCEVACSLKHEGRIWPESSMVRVFMPFPGLEVPHLCTQCSNYPCVNACPTKALSVDEKTGAVQISQPKCTACGVCTNACPGHIPHLHPDRKHIVICDLCGGDPECSKMCTKLGYDCLTTVPRGQVITYDTYAVRPKDVAKNLATLFFGEEGKKVI
jgi:anaerobic carbon-monoxide dehydrogenase iron sulfur subunit